MHLKSILRSTKIFISEIQVFNPNIFSIPRRLVRTASEPAADELKRSEVRNRESSRYSEQSSREHRLRQACDRRLRLRRAGCRIRRLSRALAASLLTARSRLAAATREFPGVFPRRRYTCRTSIASKALTENVLCRIVCRIRSQNRHRQSPTSEFAV